MVNKDRWAIIGGGNGGQALAAFFSIKGKKIRLYDVFDKLCDCALVVGMREDDICRRFYVILGIRGTSSDVCRLYHFKVIVEISDSHEGEVLIAGKLSVFCKRRALAHSGREHFKEDVRRADEIGFFVESELPREELHMGDILRRH